MEDKKTVVVESAPSLLLGTPEQLVVFLDAFPSEQLQHAETARISVVGTICLPTDRPGYLRQYKDVKPRRRSKIVKRLCKDLKNDNPWVAGAVISAPQSKWREFGVDLLASLPSGAMTPRANGAVRIGNETLGSPVAHAMGLYAVAMVYIGLWAARHARRNGTHEILFLMDQLPSSATAAMNLLRAISMSPLLLPLWSETVGVDLTFQFSNLRSVTFPARRLPCVIGRAVRGLSQVFPQLSGLLEPRIWDGRNFPGMCVADWMAQSFFAASSPDQWKQLGEGRTEAHRQAVATPWFVLLEKGEHRASIHALDDVVLRKEAED